MQDERQPGRPYCSSCGYDLTGAVASARCPECGLPLVDVLVRHGQTPTAGKRYRSKARLFGLPVIDIALGPGPDGPRGRAKGFIAIGDIATGVLAMGGFARGVVALGGFAVGLLSLGGCSIGLLTSAGGAALGGMAMGGFAAGGFARGGGAIGYMADGGGAFGYFARGGGAFGAHTISPMTADPLAVDMFDNFAWFFGPWPSTPGSMFIVFGGMVMLTLALTGLIGLIAFVKHSAGRDHGASWPSA